MIVYSMCKNITSISGDNSFFTSNILLETFEYFYGVQKPYDVLLKALCKMTVIINKLKAAFRKMFYLVIVALTLQHPNENTAIKLCIKYVITTELLVDVDACYFLTLVYLY